MMTSGPFSFRALFALTLAVGLGVVHVGTFAASSAGLDDEDPPAKAAPAPAKPAEKPKATKPSTVKVDPAASPEDKKTDATTCADGNCKGGQHKDPTPKPIEPKVYTSDQREACYRNIILRNAKILVRDWYGNRDASRGKCALGVRSMLTAAGFNHLGGLGNAYDYKRFGKMKSLGFKDIFYPGMQPQDAPPGAVLVFKGYKTDETGGYLPPKRQRGGHAAGAFVGHVTIKGDNGFYYTDGRTIAPAVARRWLAAVYVPNDCQNCSARVKKECGE